MMIGSAELETETTFPTLLHKFVKQTMKLSKGERQRSLLKSKTKSPVKSFMVVARLLTGVFLSVWGNQEEERKCAFCSIKC